MSLAKHVLLSAVLIFAATAYLFLEGFYNSPSGTQDPYNFSLYLRNIIFKKYYLTSRYVGKLDYFRNYLRQGSLQTEVKEDDLEVRYANITYDSSSPSVYSIKGGHKDSGKVQIEVVAYTPKNGPISGNKLPLFVYFYGGGWALNDLLVYKSFLTKLSRLGFAVVSVNYRKSPEFSFPAGFNDCVQTLLWAHNVTSSPTAPQTSSKEENAIVQLLREKADPNKLIVGGDSAGGLYVTTTVTYVHDLHQKIPSLSIQPKMQFLTYPALYYPGQNETAFPSYEKYAKYGYFIDRKVLTTMWNDLAGPNLAPIAGSIRYLSPLSALQSFTHFPPTLLIRAGHDILSSEGRAFEQKLVEAGVEVTVLERESMFHAFLKTGACPESMNKIRQEANRILSLGSSWAQQYAAQVEQKKPATAVSK